MLGKFPRMTCVQPPLAGFRQLKLHQDIKAKSKFWHQNMNTSERYILTNLITLFRPSIISPMCQRGGRERAVTETRRAINAESHMKTHQWSYETFLFLKQMLDVGERGEMVLAANQLCITPVLCWQFLFFLCMCVCVASTLTQMYIHNVQKYTLRIIRVCTLQI